MVRYAVFSDIHGNLEALEAFEANSRQQEVDYYLCGGDIVGYGADPVACLEKVKSLCAKSPNDKKAIVIGNHDAAAAQSGLTNMNRYAEEALEWTRKRLSTSARIELASLPLSWQLNEEIFLVHASPRQPEVWPYIMDTFDIRLAMEKVHQKICFVGHTHSPLIAEIPPGEKPHMIRSEGAELNPGSRYLINAGSAGQPRDSDPRGSYVIYDTERGTVERFRFEYDIPAAQEKIIRAGLPSILAQRLAAGF